MTKKDIKIKKIYSVPDTNGASNFGGIASDGSTIFAIKSNQAETVATLHEYKKDDSVVRTKFTELNHTNGLAYYGGSVYVPLWGDKNNKKGICRISLHDHKKHIINGDFTVSNITHYKGGYFITRTATSTDKTKQTFYVIQIDGSSYKKVKKFYVKNPVVSDGYKTNQDIFYYNGYLYIMETKANLLKSAVLVAKIGDPTASTVYSCKEVWLSGNTTKWEIESMCMHNGRVLFGMNTSSDGIYEKEEDGKMVFNIVAGHSKSAPGASKYLNEVTEDRKVKDSLINILKENGHTVYDCTSDSSTKNGCLSEQVTKCKKHYGIDVHIHFNAGTSDNDNKTTGCEVFVYSSSSKVKDKATEICKELNKLGFKNRGVKYSTSLYVLRNATNPALLVEVCFVDDKDDANLYKKLGVHEISNAIAKGLIENVIKSENTEKQPINASFVVRITAAELNVRKEPSASSDVVTVVTKGECFTITDVVYNGSTAWGKLKSEVGYISLAYTEKI